jgi:DNA primase
LDERDIIKENIRSRIDFVEFVGRYVSLSSKGDRFVGLCPFHEEKSASFGVNPTLGMFHCFGCKAGGDLFEFAMLIERLQFPQALEFLANIAGVALPEYGGKASPNFKIRDLNERAAVHFEKTLASPEGSAAVEYLKARDIDGTTAKKFRLGYAPDEWRCLIQAFPNQGKGLETLGLTITNKRGTTYDRFRGRVMFTLCDLQGQVVGFAGRYLNPEPDSPKYVNTPVTPLLKKGEMLYALNLAKEDAIQKKTLVLVEGYTDVIRAHMHGFNNVVASMGTALTQTQARLCARFVGKVVLAFDQDLAGQLATLRGIRALLNEGLDVRMLQLEPGTDPDDFIQTKGIEAFSKLVDDAKPFFDVFVQMLQAQFDIGSFEGKKQLLDAALPLLQGLSNLHWRSHIITELSSTLNLPYEEIERLAQQKPASPSNEPSTPPESTPERLDMEEHLFYFLINGQLSFERATTELEKEDFARYGEFWDALIACYESHGSVGFDSLYNELEERWKGLLNRLSVSDLHVSDPAQVVDEILRRVKEQRLTRELEVIKLAIRQAEADGNTERATQLQGEYIKIKRLEANFRKSHGRH